MGWGRVIAAIAAAGTLYYGPAWGDSPVRPMQPSAIYFAGVDAWTYGAFAHTGVLWSPAGLDNPGFTLKLLINGGTYSYQSDAVPDANVVGHLSNAALLPGWRFTHDKSTVTIFGGVDLQRHVLSPNDPTGRLNGDYFGLRMAAEFWTEPMPGVMLATDAFASTIGPSGNLHAAFGWRIVDLFYAGPEAQIFLCADYGQYRLGVHVTAWKLGPLEWSTAVGWSQDSDLRAGLYGRFGLTMRR